MERLERVFTPQFIWQIATWCFAQIIAGCVLYAAITNRMTAIETNAAVSQRELSEVRAVSNANHDSSLRQEGALNSATGQLAQERSERLASFDQLKAWIDQLKDRTSRIEGTLNRR